MKKKIIGIAVAASLMLTGVVSAASVWGSYKGNDIIRITSNGAAIKTTDVPAINYNGRTMIPINMLLQLGIPYTWDQTNKTVDVTVTSSTVSSSITTDSIKNAVKYADFFHNLESLGESLSRISSEYFTAASNIIANSPSSKETLNNANDHLNSIIEFYNASYEEAKRYSDNDLNYVLTNYYDSIDYYKKMDSALNSYYSNRSSENMTAFTSSNTLGIKSAINGTKKANQKYTDYINIALNTK
jgi:hypothetical protein